MHFMAVKKSSKRSVNIGILKGKGLDFGSESPCMRLFFNSLPPPPREIRVLDLNELGLSIFAKNVI